MLQGIHSYAFLLFLLLSSVQLCAQDYVELGQVGYRHAFRTAETEEMPGTSVSGFRLNLMLPVKVGEKTYLLPGARMWQYHLDPGANLNFYMFQMGVQHQLNDKWSLQVLPLLRSASYEDARFSDGLQFGFLGIASEKIKDNLTLGYGIYTNHELFGQLLTPVLAIDWQINSRWRLYGNFPMYNTLSYRISDKWFMGLNYIGLVTSFKGNTTYIERESLDFSWFFEYYLTKNLVLQSQVGYTADRSYVEYDEDDKINFALSLLRFGDDRTPLATFDQSSMFILVNLLFRVKK